MCLVNGGSPNGPTGGFASVRVTYPAAIRSSSRIRCTHALMSARCEKTWGKFPRCQPVRFYLLGPRQQRAGVGRQHLAQRPGARLASPISVSAETSHNERFGAPPADLVERITTVQFGSPVVCPDADGRSRSATRPTRHRRWAESRAAESEQLPADW